MDGTYFNYPTSNRASAYTLLLLLLFSLLAGCSMGPSRTGSIDDELNRSSKPPSKVAQGILTEAYNLVGVPYRTGGADPKGFDCSGLVQYVHSQVGLEIPRSTAEQLKSAKWVRFSQLQPGDLVFFRISGSKADHVGIYWGDGRFIHAPNRGKEVSFAHIDSDYWNKRIIAAGRFY